MSGCENEYPNTGLGEIANPDAVLVAYQPGYNSRSHLFVMKPHRRPFVDFAITSAGRDVEDEARDRFDIQSYDEETTLAEFTVTDGGVVDDIAWRDAE